MLRFTLTTIILLFFISWSPAQPSHLDSLTARTIYSNSVQSSWPFSYKPNLRDNNNRILNQLALAHLKVPEKTSFVYNFSYHVDVNFQRNDSLQVMLALTPESVIGEKNIKHFSLEKILKPSIYNIHVVLENPSRGRIIDKKITLKLNGTKHHVISFPDSLWSEGTQVLVKFDDIKFSDEDFRIVELELMAIRDYYASVALGDSLLKKIHSARINTRNIEQVIMVYTSGVKGLFLLEQSLSSRSIIVPGADPLNLKQKTGIIQYRFNEYLEYLENSRQKFLTGNVYHKIAVAYLQSLRDANKMSQVVDYYSSPFFYKLYSNTITSAQLNDASKWLFSQAQAKNIKGFDITKLSTAINKEYLLESEKLLNLDRYVEAVDLLTGAKKYSTLNPCDTYSEQIEVYLKKARKGLVMSYTGIIQKALDKQLMTLAEKYLAEVENYAKKYDLGDSETNNFESIYRKMADIHSQLGYNHLTTKNYRSALDEFSRASEFSLSNSNGVKAKIDDGILISVRGIYNSLVSKAINSLGEGRYETAELDIQRAESFAADYSFFYPDRYQIDSIRHGIAKLKYNTLVHDIEDVSSSNITGQTIKKIVDLAILCKQFNFNETTQFDSLVAKIGVAHVNSLFSVGRAKQTINQPDSALYYANEAFTLARLFEIENTRNFKEQYTELVKLSSELYCNEARIEFASYYERAKQSFVNTRFREALSIIDEARELVYAKSPCGLSTIPLNELLNEYQNHLKWDEMIRKSFVLIEKSEFENAAKLIQQAEAIFTFYRLDTTGMKNKGYFDLAMISENTTMIKHAISYLMIRGKLDKSFALLDKLRIMGVSQNETSDIQESLARNLSTRDKNNNTSLNVKEVLNSYTKGNKWYQKFDKMYRFYTKV